FTQPGYSGECKAARDTFPAVNRLADTLRAAGGHVIWVQTCSDGADTFWEHFQRDLLRPELGKKRLEELSAKHSGFELAPGVHATDDDVRVVKKYYSALATDSSNL